MEIVEAKLNSNDPVVVSQVFSRLVTSFGTKTAWKQEFAYLKAKCLSENDLISDVARMTLLKLLDNDCFHVEQILGDFVTSISTASNTVGLTKTIICLLNWQLSQNKASIKQSGLMEHPIVKILQIEVDCDVQICIYKGILHGFYLDKSPLLSIIYSPLYLYTICNPTIKLKQGILREKLWAFLVQNDLEVVFKLLCWMQMQNKNSELASIMLNELFQTQINNSEPLKNLEYLIVVQIQIIHNMLMDNRDCRFAIKSLLLILEKFSPYCHYNLALLMLSRAFMVCSPVCLEDLLRLCYYLANQNVCQPYSFLALKSALLHWLSGPCLLTDKTLKIANDILKLNDHVGRERPLILASRLSIDRFHFLTFCNPEIFFSLHLGIKMDCTREDDVSGLIRSFEEAPMHFWKKCFNFLSGLLLNAKLIASDKIRVLAMLVRCSTHHLECLPTLLTVILYEISNCDDNTLHFELLKVLPLMAKVKENVPKVIATIQAISKQSSVLSNFALRLMYDTWEVENKCYSALESISLQRSYFKEEVFELNISRAYVFMKLSEKRPELYGKDLVAYLSKILNECTTSEGSVASALALEGIRHLCKAEVIDVVTTWATLLPKFKGDTRAPVIKSLCRLINEIPSLEYAQSYDKLNDEAVGHLWMCAIQNQDPDVVNEALDALASFNLELICTHMPEKYFADEGREHVGDQRMVPGKVWLKFLATFKFREAARNFLVKLVASEISHYLKYVYQLKAQKEPDNYSRLPTHSIVRALAEHLKRDFAKVKVWENSAPCMDLFIDCLQILSVKYSKPLPPLDWCFLQELVHVPLMKPYCLKVASHQAILSGSARRLMENYIVALTEASKVSGEEAIHVYRNLRYLANSIQPIILKPFFEGTLYDVPKEDFFEEALTYMRVVLEDNDVQDVNKNVIEEVLSELIFISEVPFKRFPILLTCAVSFSQNSLEKITKFNRADEFQIITKIRCHICTKIKSNRPLVWLNDIFQVACSNKIGIPAYFEDVTSALKANLDHEESPAWLNELFSEIQAKVADRCEPEEIGYFCDVLALAVHSFSGLFTLMPRYDYGSIKYFFPAGIAFLLDEPKWGVYTVQVLEWLHHMTTAENMPDDYQHIYGWALSSLRHQEEFSKGSRWMKYLGCSIYDNK